MTNLSLKQPHFARLGNAGALWVRENIQTGTVFARLVQTTIDIGQGEVCIAILTEDQQNALRKQHSLNWATESELPSLQAKHTLLLRKLQDLEKKWGPLAIVGIDDVERIATKKYTHPDLPHCEYESLELYCQKVSNIKSYRDFEILELTVAHSNSVFVVPQNDFPTERHLTHTAAVSLATSVIAIINDAFHSETFTLWVKDRSVSTSVANK